MTKTPEGDGGVLFVCIENAGRSQIAEAFAKRKGMPAESAGTMPAKVINPVVVQAMREVGIDMEHRKPKLLTKEMIERAEVVVTMGCSVEDVCPRPMLALMGKKLIEWHIEDPKGKGIEGVRRIRDEIERKVAELKAQLSML
ncbi:MAG: arsenate reductase ArsC [Methanomassiliicoccales archaeon]